MDTPNDTQSVLNKKKQELLNLQKQSAQLTQVITFKKERWNELAAGIAKMPMKFEEFTSQEVKREEQKKLGKEILRDGQVSNRFAEELAKKQKEIASLELALKDPANFKNSDLLVILLAIVGVLLLVGVVLKEHQLHTVEDMFNYGVPVVVGIYIAVRLLGIMGAIWKQTPRGKRLARYLSEKSLTVE
jgi:hypothetical protein